MSDAFRLPFSRPLGRRSLIALGAAGAGVALLPGRLKAQAANEVVLALWGGPSADAFLEIYGSGFTEDTGAAVVADTSGPEPAKIRAMVEAGQVTWDVADVSIADSVLLGQAGIFRPIDYAIVPKDSIIPGFAFEFGVTSYIFSSILSFDKKALGGNVPASWADFWDLERFPGKRALRRHIEGVLEAAVLADGVPLDQVYPIDEERAFAKLEQILPETIFWNSGSESQQLMRDGDVVMGNLWSTRATQLWQEDGERFGLDFNGELCLPAAWAVPADNPGGDLAFKFIAAALDPERQARAFAATNLSPSNPAAAEFVTPADAAINPTAPENLARQVPIDVQWYIDNQERVQTRFLEMLGG